MPAPLPPPLFLDFSLFINALAERALQSYHNLSHIDRSLAQGFRPFQLQARPRLGVPAPSRDRSRGKAMTDSGLKERGFLAEGRRIWTEKPIPGKPDTIASDFFDEIPRAP